MGRSFEGLQGFASSILVIDSFSTDNTIERAMKEKVINLVVAIEDVLGIKVPSLMGRNYCCDSL